MATTLLRSSLTRVSRRCIAAHHFSSIAIDTRKDAVTSSDGVVGVPIDFDLASSIEGKESQVRYI